MGPRAKLRSDCGTRHTAAPSPPQRKPQRQRLVAKTGEGWREAKLFRLRGELFLLHAEGRGGSRIAPAEDTETCFHQALTVTRGQQARSVELRAAMSLGRLWQQGRRGQARELLAPLYSWSTEGFDTADSQEANALLHEL